MFIKIKDLFYTQFSVLVSLLTFKMGSYTNYSLIHSIEVSLARPA